MAKIATDGVRNYEERRLTNPDSAWVEVVADLHGVAKAEAKRLIKQGAVTLFILLPEGVDGENKS